MEDKNWIKTWTETNIMNTKSLRVPKNPTTIEIHAVIGLCLQRINKLSNCIDSYTMYIDNGKQYDEAQKHNRQIWDKIDELKLKLKDWKQKHNVK